MWNVANSFEIQSVIISFPRKKTHCFTRSNSPSTFLSLNSMATNGTLLDHRPIFLWVGYWSQKRFGLGRILVTLFDCWLYESETIDICYIINIFARTILPLAIPYNCGNIHWNAGNLMVMRMPQRILFRSRFWFRNDYWMYNTKCPREMPISIWMKMKIKIPKHTFE